MLRHHRPFDNSLYNDIVIEEDAKALKILNHRLESFFAFHVPLLRKNFRKKVCNSKKDWRKLLGTTKLYEVIVPSSKFAWTVPTDNNPNTYHSDRVLITYETRAAKYYETVDSMYYDGPKTEIIPVRGEESIWIYFPKQSEDKPFAVSGDCVKIPIKFNSIIATLGGKNFMETLTKAIKAWRDADLVASRAYKVSTILPMITAELQGLANTTIPKHIQDLKYVPGEQATAIRLCLKHINKAIKSYFDKGY